MSFASQPGSYFLVPSPRLSFAWFTISIQQPTATQGQRRTAVNRVIAEAHGGNSFPVRQSFDVFNHDSIWRLEELGIKLQVVLVEQIFDRLYLWAVHKAYTRRFL